MAAVFILILIQKLLLMEIKKIIQILLIVQH